MSGCPNEVYIAPRMTSEDSGAMVLMAECNGPVSCGWSVEFRDEDGDLYDAAELPHWTLTSGEMAHHVELHRAHAKPVT